MSKMAEIDMMVQDAIEMVEHDGMYLMEAMEYVAKEWALDSEEFDIVYREANARVYPPTV